MLFSVDNKEEKQGYISDDNAFYKETQVYL